MLLNSYGMMSKRPNVVRSLGWDLGYHEEIRNGPENKIHIRKVQFRSSGMVSVFSSECSRRVYKYHRYGVGRLHGCVMKSGMVASCPWSLGGAMGREKLTL